MTLPRLSSHSTFQHKHVEFRELSNCTRPAKQHHFGSVIPCHVWLESYSYNLLMSNVASKLFTYNDNVMSRSTTLRIRHFPSNVESDSTTITSITTTCRVLHSYLTLDLAPTFSRSILQYQHLIHMSSSNFHSITACYTVMQQVLSCTASSRASFVYSRAHML